MSTAATLDMERLSAWVGNTEEVADTITQRLAASFHATLDRPGAAPAAGEAVPPGFHWLLCPPIAARSQLGPDGHPARGGFLPPVPLPRRMWASSAIAFHAELRVGDEVTRRSEVTSLTRKQGRSGDLVFLGIRHAYHSACRLCLEEDQTVVYREQPPADNGTAAVRSESAPEQAALLHSITPDPVMLFRYSAITFNGHRIHYDPDYCRAEEHYPGCVIHGPLTGTLLLLAANALAGDRPIRHFEFKARSPAFLGDRLDVHGQGDATGIEVRALNQHGTLVMSATAHAH